MQKNESLKLNEERLNQQVAEMQLRIDALEFENSELKSRRSNGRSLLISDIMFEINYYQPSEQIHMFNMLRSLIAGQDENWIEKIKTNEEQEQHIDIADWLIKWKLEPRSESPAQMNRTFQKVAKYFSPECHEEILALIEDFDLEVW